MAALLPISGRWPQLRPQGVSVDFGGDGWGLNQKIRGITWERFQLLPNPGGPEKQGKSQQKWKPSSSAHGKKLGPGGFGALGPAGCNKKNFRGC